MKIRPQHPPPQHPLWRQGRRLLHDDRGAVLVYVSIIAVAMVGMVGLAIDGGRIFTTHTQAQSAADAAAIAAAYQLDGRADALDRAQDAAQGSPLVSNTARFAGDGGVVIASMRFMDSLPPLNARGERDIVDCPVTAGTCHTTSDPAAARFVEVVTEELEQPNFFVRLVGAAGQSTTRARAVAGLGEEICRAPILFLCNPAEPSGDLTYPWEELYGVQVTAKAGAGSQAAGNFGLVAPPGASNVGNTGVVSLLGNAEHTNVCVDVNEGVVTAPGNTPPVVEAINVRLGMYPKNGKITGVDVLPYDPNFRPSGNIISGYVPTPDEPGHCTSDGAPATGLAYPEDKEDHSLFTPADGDARFGNGDWDCPGYWTDRGYTDPIPQGCQTGEHEVDFGSGPQKVRYTRFDLYQDELKMIEENGYLTSGLVDSESEYDPELEMESQCYTGSNYEDLVKESLSNSRREVYLAVVNCEDEGVTGTTLADPVQPVEYVRAFLSHRAYKGSNPGTDNRIVVELLEPVGALQHTAVKRDIVQLY